MFLRSFSKRLLAGSPLFVHYWCHPPHSSSALGTRVTPTPLEQKVYSNIYSGRERNIENVGRYANSWLVERYF